MPPHEFDFLHEHYHSLTSQEQAEYDRAAAAQDTLELLTMGMDVGSSTSHLLFARVRYQREGVRRSERFAVVDRQIVFRSAIMLTPFSPDGTIDAGQLSQFVQESYHAAGFTPDDVEGGAVILTGEAIKRTNARAITEIFARDAGKFTCATAGHNFESLLAAHGSGAAALSRHRRGCGLHVDIGGGTTKLALIDEGEVHSLSAFAVGGRLLAQDASGLWTRIDDSAKLVAAELGLAATPEVMGDGTVRQRVAERLATLVVDQILEGPIDQLGESLQLTELLERTLNPQYLTISGGVAEYIFGRETIEYGDIAPLLARAIAKELGARVSIPVIEPKQCIRATVIGASQFTVQVSGKTVHVSGDVELPVRNVPVIRCDVPSSEEIDSDEVAARVAATADRQDADLSGVVALAARWNGSATHARLTSFAKAVQRAAPPGSDGKSPLFLIVDVDVGHALGHVLTEELCFERDLVSLDGIELNGLDFVDVGAFVDPPGVYPVVVKSLLFQ